MYCTLLSEIDSLNDLQKESIDKFLQTFLPNGYVTVSKACEYTGMLDKIIADTFSKLYLKGYLDIVYAIRCPECGHLIKKIDDINCFRYVSIDSCYACDLPIDISIEDIVILFEKREKSPFERGQYRGNELLVKSDIGIALSDTVEYLKSISETFTMIAGIQTDKLVSDEAKDEKLRKMTKRAYRRYRKNKNIYTWAIIVFRCISLAILFSVLYFAEPQGMTSVFVTVIIYTFQNVIDVILKSCIITDLNELERDEMYVESQKQ